MAADALHAGPAIEAVDTEKSTKWLINAHIPVDASRSTSTASNVGFLKKFSGLAMEADIVANDLGPDNVQKKHVSNIKWTPAKATIGIGMGKEMYEWIKAAFDKGYVTKRRLASRRPTSTTRRSRASTS